MNPKLTSGEFFMKYCGVCNITCCKYPGGVFCPNNEAKQILQLNPNSLRKNRISRFGRTLEYFTMRQKRAGCIFWDSVTKRCNAHEVRPTPCRNWPITFSLDLAKMQVLYQYANDCPAGAPLLKEHTDWVNEQVSQIKSFVNGINSEDCLAFALQEPSSSPITFRREFVEPHAAKKIKRILGIKNVLILEPITTDKWDLVDAVYASKKLNKRTLVGTAHLEKGVTSVIDDKDVSKTKRAVIDFCNRVDGIFDAIIVNCVLDVGVDNLKHLKSRVVGPGEISLRAAASQSNNVLVIAGEINELEKFIDRIRPRINANILTREIAVSLYDLEVALVNRNKHNAIQQKIIRAIKEDGRPNLVVVLGCTGYINFKESIEAAIGAKVIEPLEEALTRV